MLLSSAKRQNSRFRRSSSLSSSSNTRLLSNGLSGLPWTVPSNVRWTQPILHYTTSKDHTDKTQDAFIAYVLRKAVYETVLIYQVEKLRQVQIYHMFLS